MSFFRLVYDGFRNSAYLLRSNHSKKIKKKLFSYMIKINLKYLLTSKLMKLKKEKIFQYNIRAFDYASIRQLFEEIFYRNEYYFKTKNKNPVIIDCGANIGFSIIFFKWLYPDSTIYGFEPDKRTFELLEKNIAKNELKNVHLINVAVSNKSGKIDFFIDPEHPGNPAMSTRYGRMPKYKTIVQSISLSSFIKKNNIRDIDFIKMDIEGSEKEVLKDLDKNKMFNRIKKLLIEYHHKIVGEKSCLGDYLKILEKNKFEYQIDARCIPISSHNKNQGDMLIYCYRNEEII
jgi:FkbM family methyltransferase